MRNGTVVSLSVLQRGPEGPFKCDTAFVHASCGIELVFLYPQIDYTLRGNIVIEYVKRQMHMIIIVFH